jgi:hypothetical protein
MATQVAEDTTDESQTDTATPEVADGAGTPPDANEATLLRSRQAGLSAKVTHLKAELAALVTERDAAVARASDLEQGKVSGEEALRAQLSAKEAEIEQTRREATTAKLSAKYPESARELGDLIGTFPEDKLAALEARLVGEVEDTSPTRGMRAPKNASAGPPRPETSQDIMARLRSFQNPFGS